MQRPNVEGMQAVLDDVLRQVSDPMTLLQLVIVVVALVASWVLGRRWKARPGEGWRADLRHRVSQPFIVLALVALGMLVLRLSGQSYPVLAMVAALSLSLVLIRAFVYLLRRVLRPGPVLEASEQLISGLIWLGVALYLVGWLGPTFEFLDSAAVKFGDTSFSLLDLLLLVVLAATLVLVATLVSRLVERRVMAAGDLSIGLRVGVAKVVRFVVVLLAILVSLNLVGINLTSLAVFSGALGVGLGFGLQRIASNFISGFILIMDRSIRPGDVITIGDSFGWVQELNARYVVVRNRDGVDMLIPNENLITSEVINWSYADKSVRLKVPVDISYDDDPVQAMGLLVEVAKGSKRVESAPEPVARLLAFGDSGIELELRVWINDPQEGVNNIRSELNVGIWKAFKEAGITIPFPQRDLHVKSMPRAPDPNAGD
ncbi:mechanosensitive ion channel family protein [Alkalisalibacterium limincola]|uniref:Mechanosensitive ion channel n=1 Tax=Alkalisalibacterium limincola TaxID=2699169 RepID=A0A5C8KQY4_9GAMM|nr:mechanosensitive ion channel domain-containing protein [Alkalisalibacterium limincola]TXK62116.1 mechanosensitive ion channel [Alkalisalibacterium limincola]